jgi:glycosyltransferase involved in cell wall biosynthesis
LKGFYDHVSFQATNQQELNDLKAQFKNANAKIIANVSNASPIHLNKSKQENVIDLFFLSRISKVKNLHFALEVLSKVSSSIKVNYTIYGNIEDAAYWEHCSQLISKLPAHINVNYKGELAFDKIQTTIAQHHFLFLPTLNENFGHSIVESLMSGCPLIISDQTPWNNVKEANAGFAIPLNDHQQFVDVIEQTATLTNEAYQVKANAAITYISKKINIPLIKEKYLKLFHAAS